jgi:hypothetical protein
VGATRHGGRGEAHRGLIPRFSMLSGARTSKRKGETMTIMFATNDGVWELVGGQCHQVGLAGKKISHVSRCHGTTLAGTENYTRKADNRESGGVGFETIISSHEYKVRTAEERARFIPIIRDNGLPEGRKLPKYLGSAIYVDMSGDNWHAKPMLALVNAIRRHI